MRKDFLIFGAPSLGQEEIDEVVATLRSGWIGTGPKVERFQEMFRDYIGAPHAMALNSGTAALHLSLLVSGIGPGDEVITTPLTFCATANAIVHTGATPVFADVDRRTMLIDTEAVERAVTERTRAIIPVHLAGRPCDMDALGEIARRHKLLIMEDAAHAIEASYKGRKIGTIADATCFSFYVTKNITTCEGGMVTTANGEWAEKIKTYGLHGLSHDAWMRYSDRGYRHYQVTVPGFKYNMTDLQASLGIHQLKKIASFFSRRCEIWDTYTEAFKALPVELPAPIDRDTVHARHLYTLLVDEERAGVRREEFQRRLHELNIGTGVHFVSLHLHEYYRERFGFSPDDFPNSAYLSARTVSIPFSAKLSDEDVRDVIEAVKRVVKA